MTEDSRPNPDALLASLARDPGAVPRGRLKVFLGMCPGVGKTFAMLESARREKAAGRDVLVGHVEAHGRPETDALLEGLPVLPRLEREHRGVRMAEFDLDAALARRPSLLLVDELAHTNVPGTRHPKRWQDVLELLDAGIDVATTLNVQHVESLSEMVREITGATQGETVPDSVLDAATVELVDLAPSDLLERMRHGRIYGPERAREAERGFFRSGNLTALREIALRYAARHAGTETRRFVAGHVLPGVWKTAPRLLVAVSPSPTSASMVRWVRHYAALLDARWMAVHVDTGRVLSAGEQDRLRGHLEKARELGAEVLTTSDPDVTGAVLRLARQHHVTQIVVGKPAPAGWRAWVPGHSVLSRLVAESGNVDVLCVKVPDGVEAMDRGSVRLADGVPGGRARPYAAAVGVVAVLTAVNLLVEPLTGPYAPSYLYLTGVVVLALRFRRGPVLAAATVAALAWNFLFLPPVHTFVIARVEDALLFLLFFVVALAMGHLTSRLRQREEAERRREERATALYLLIREIAAGRDLSDVLAIAVREIGKAFDADAGVAIADPSAPGRLVPYPFGAFPWDDSALGVADWAWRNRRPAGRGTDTLGSADALHLPLRVESGVLGVVAVRRRDGRAADFEERQRLESFAAQVALVVERHRLRESEERARLRAESERLGAALLNSVSHELRTPLAAVAAGTAALRQALADGSRPERPLAEIEEASARLRRLVANLLDVTRIESGQLRPHADWCDVRDLVDAARREAPAGLASHPVSVEVGADVPLVRADAQLCVQALQNLLANAVAHTPPGTPVAVVVDADPQWVRFRVSDRGPGIPATELPRIFDRFHRAPGAPAGGTGLGLAIVRGFVEAQGGQVEAGPNPGGGAVFTLRLPRLPEPTIPDEAGE